MRIFVGNLYRETTTDELRQVFELYGAIRHVTIIVDRETGRSPGYAFVEMPDPTEATAAIAGLHRTTLGGRTLVVDVAHAWTETARPRQERRLQLMKDLGNGDDVGWTAPAGGRGRYVATLPTRHDQP
jgi:RNA recognition motif-containing protein